MLLDLLHRLPRPLFAPEEGAGAAAVADPGTAAAAAPTDADKAAADPGTAPAAKWWESPKLSDAHRTALTAKGLTLNDPMEALHKLIDMQVNAEKRLGAPADRLLTKPKDGESVADWMRQNATLFGIPEAPDKYDIKKPADWPKDAQWNTALETQVRQIGHEEGLSGKALQRLTEAYAGSVKSLMDGAEAELQKANGEMMAELERDWGAQTPARLAQAQQAASVLGEKAGLNPEQIQSLAQTLKPKVGDAGTIRLFAAIGEMLGDDTALGLGRGGGSLGITPAEARQQIAALRAPDGAYGKAYAAQDRREMARLQPEIERLTKIAAGS